MIKLIEGIYTKSLLVITARVIGAFTGVLLTYFIANLVSVEIAGSFFLIIAITQAGGGILTLATTNILIKVIGSSNCETWGDINRLTSVVLKKIIYLTIFIVFIVFVTMFFLKSTLLYDFLLLIPFLMFFYALTQVFAAMLQGKGRTVIGSLIQQAVAPIIFIVVIYTLTFFSLETSGQLSYYYLVCLICAALLGGFIWFSDKKAKFIYHSKLNMAELSALKSLFMTMIMSLLAIWSAQFTTAIYLTSSDVAYFATAQRTALLASFVLVSINLIVAPKYADAFKNGSVKEVNYISLVTSRLMILISTPILFFMLMCPSFIMSLFGEDYTAAAPLLQIMAVGQFINAITGSVGYLLNMTNHEKDMRNVVLFSGPLAIILAFVLTKEFGLIGAAYATAIALATQNLLAVWMVKKRLGFNTLNIFRKIA